MCTGNQITPVITKVCINEISLFCCVQQSYMYLLPVERIAHVMVQIKTNSSCNSISYTTIQNGKTQMSAFQTHCICEKPLSQDEKSYTTNDQI